MKISTFTVLASFFFFFLLAPSNSFCQILITQSDMPVAGQNILTYTDTSVSVVPGSPSSTAQTWNFISLLMPQTNNNLIRLPSSTPYASTFTSANIADSLIYAPGYYYYSSTPSAYFEVGYVTHLYGYTAGINIHPFVVQLPLPATYGTIDGGICRGDTSIPISYGLFDSGRAIVTIYYADTIDAFGSITTPYGTDSVIRQKHYELDLDSIFVHVTAGSWNFYEVIKNTNYQYKWYANGVPTPLALMQMDSVNNNVVSVTWFDGVSLGINELGVTSNVHIYPNPCISQITITSIDIGAKYLTVCNISGEQLTTVEVRNGIARLNTSNYPEGMYFYTISGSITGKAERGKFLVVK